MDAISLASMGHADLCQVYVLLVVPSILTIFIKSNCPVSNPYNSGSALILQSAGFFITSPDVCTLECCTETQLSPQFRKTFSELLLLSEVQHWCYTIRYIFQKITTSEINFHSLLLMFHLSHSAGEISGQMAYSDPNSTCLLIITIFFPALVFI